MERKHVSLAQPGIGWGAHPELVLPASSGIAAQQAVIRPPGHPGGV